MPSDVRPRGSLCHRLPNPLKLLLTLGVIFVSVSLPVSQWPALGLLATFVFIGLSLAEVPLAYLLRRLLLFLPMLCSLAISFPLSTGFQSGWEMFAAIVMRGSISFLSALWLINVLPFAELLETLQRLRVPAVFVTMLGFMHRYSLLLWEELERMRTARRARQFHRGGFWFHWKSLAQTIGMLLIRSLTRAERIHQAMNARGWQGEFPNLETALKQEAERERKAESDE